MSPTRCVEAGQPIRPGSTKIAESSGWILHSNIEGPDIELDESLRSLLDKMGPCAESLCELEREGYSIVWRCVVATNDLEHDIELDRATLQRLVALPGVLRLDVYDDARLWENKPGDSVKAYEGRGRR